MKKLLIIRKVALIFLRFSIALPSMKMFSLVIAKYKWFIYNCLRVFANSGGVTWKITNECSRIA